MKPKIEKGIFEIEPSQVLYDNTPTLFPYDFVGVYNKQKFVNLGGFDISIKSTYWQNLDFSIRTWLWGEKIITSPIFRFAYEISEPILDSTVDNSYFRFYLKNIAPVYKVNYGYIPNTISGDGEELDAYLVGVFEPVEEFKGEVIAIIHRTNDDDDKLVVAPKGVDYSDDAIRALTEFQEKYFESIIIR